jgi:hypothetical protein
VVYVAFLERRLGMPVFVEDGELGFVTHYAEINIP